jgi:hypothetical protein
VSEPDITEIARSIVEENRFMARGTADASGTPWVSPVWYAPLSSRAYVWVSRPATRHSRNLAERPRVAIAIYDSHRPGTWAASRRRRRGARGGRRRARCLQPTIRGAGLRAWSRDEVVPPADFRLYRATAVEQYVLDDHDARLPVPLGEA